MDDITGTLRTSDGLFAVTIRAVAAESEQRRRTTYPKTTRIRLLAIQDHHCALCKGPLGLYDSHIDHIIPRSAGGSDDYSNLQLTHMTCNLRKGAGRGPHDKSQERMPWA